MNGEPRRTAMRKLITQRNDGIALSLRRGWAAFRRHALGVLGLASLAGFVSVAVLAPQIVETYPQIHGTEWTAPPQNECPPGMHCLGPEIPTARPPKFGDPYWAVLGTTERGKDVLGQLLLGSRLPVFVGLAAGFLAALVSLSVGVLTGHYDDTHLGRRILGFADALHGVPSLPLVVCVVATLGPRPATIVFAIVVRAWIDDAAKVRTEVRRLRTQSHVEAAKVSGAADLRILAHHVLPNVLPLAAVAVATDAAAAVLAQASVAYLGFLGEDAVSWGTMLNAFMLEGGQVVDAVWWLVPPGLAISLLVASLYAVGYGLETALDPSA